MNFDLFTHKDSFPIKAAEILQHAPLDYVERYSLIHASEGTATAHQAAGVVVLLTYKNDEYVFELIKRSRFVAQSGDISCPGGILEASTDEMLSHLLFKTGMIRTIEGATLNSFPCYDNQTALLIRLFLMNALREAWEEIGLSPLNVRFLGALPTYALTYFARTIFPVVCLTSEPFEHRQSDEVEKVLEVPLSLFFNNDAYAEMEIRSALGEADPRYHVKFPCLIIPDAQGGEDILWGATYHILTRFLQMVTGVPLPSSPLSRIVTKTLSTDYTSGKRG
ncbi:MAG: CoA pyrophosphatase [Smithellaceae bacterium]